MRDVSMRRCCNERPGFPALSIVSMMTVETTLCDGNGSEATGEETHPLTPLCILGTYTLLQPLPLVSNSKLF